MRIIIDTNILFSALLKDSTTRRILCTSSVTFFYPEPALHAVRKYQELLIQKSGLSELEFLVLYHSLLLFIQIIPTEIIKQRWKKAKEIMEHVDEEDVIFIAAALAYGDAPVWSDDKHFDQQKEVVNFKTKDVVQLLDHLEE
jgi:predicted nucleic acid-binding protein